MLTVHIGILANKALVADTLHCLYLGVMNTWFTVTLWELLPCGAYGAASTSEASMTLNCLAFRHTLFQWYRRRKHLNPDEGLTELQEFNASMMGHEPGPQMRHTRC